MLMIRFDIDTNTVTDKRLLQKATEEIGKSFGIALKGGHLNCLSLGKESPDCDERAECVEGRLRDD